MRIQAKYRVFFSSLVLGAVFCSCIPEPEADENICTTSSIEVYVEKGKTWAVPWDSFPADEELIRVVFEPELQRHVVVAKEQLSTNLVVYDLENNQRLYDVEVPREGPFAAGSYTDFWFHRRDSIYFLDPHAYKLYLKTPHRVTSVELPVARADNYYWSTPSVNCRVYIDVAHQRLIAPMFETWKEGAEEQLFAHPWLAIVDLQNGKLLKRLGVWPKRRPVGFYECPSMVIHGDSLVAAFGLEHRMYLYKLESGQLLATVCGRGLDQLAPPRPRQTFPTFEETFRYFTEHSFYLSLYYDPWRKLYYRTFKTGKPWIDAEGKRAETYYDEWYIQVLDEKFRQAGRITIPREYDGLASFIVLPSGIWLKKGDDYRESEDFVEWQQFAVLTN